MGTFRVKFEKVLRELTVAHRARFESELALEVAAHSGNLEAVNTVNAVLLDILLTHKDEAIRLIDSDPKQMMKNAIFDPTKAMFGRMGESEELTSAELFDIIIDVLSSEKTILDQRLHTQMNVMYRVITKLEHMNTDEMKLKTAALQATVFPKDAYADRSRTPMTDTRLTEVLGIARGPLQLKTKDIAHRAAVDHMIPKRDSKFFINATETLAMPFVAGISGHTGSMLFNAILIADLDTGARQEYAMAAFSYLANGGNHSFHEVMSAASHAGVEYREGEYASAVPVSMVGVFRDLAQAHPSAGHVREFAA